MPYRFVLPSITAVALMAAGCATETETPRNKLVITGSALPTPFHVGDTSGLWTADKTVILPNGREDPQRNYPSFLLESSDTTVVGIVRERMVVGRKKGSAEITARDTKSELASEASVTVKVDLAP